MQVEIEVRTLKCDATQPIIRYWLNSGPSNFVSCLTESWNLSFSELWILQSYWILLKTEFWLNSLSQSWVKFDPTNHHVLHPKLINPRPAGVFL